MRRATLTAEPPLRPQILPRRHSSPENPLTDWVEVCVCLTASCRRSDLARQTGLVIQHFNLQLACPSRLFSPESGSKSSKSLDWWLGNAQVQNLAFAKCLWAKKNFDTMKVCLRVHEQNNLWRVILAPWGCSQSPSWPKTSRCTGRVQREQNATPLEPSCYRSKTRTCRSSTPSNISDVSNSNKNHPADQFAARLQRINGIKMAQNVI